MEWRFTSAVQNAFGGSKIRKMNRPSVIRARGHMVSLYPYRHMSNVHNDNEHSVNRSNRKIAPVFVYPALRVMYSTATPCRVSIVTLDGKEATSGISSTPIKL